MVKRKAAQGLQCITKFFKATSNSPAADGENHRIPVDSKTEENTENSRNEDEKSKLERNAKTVDSYSEKSTETDNENSLADRLSEVVDHPQDSVGPCPPGAVTPVRSDPSVSLEVPFQGASCQDTSKSSSPRSEIARADCGLAGIMNPVSVTSQETSKSCSSRSELARADFGLAAIMNPVSNSSQKSQPKGGVCENGNESKTTHSDNNKPENKGTPSFTRAPVTYKEYKEAKRQREMEEQRRKAEACKKTSHNSYQRHHSLTNLSKHSPAGSKKGPAHLCKRSASLDVSSSTSPSSPCKASTVYQHSSYFGHEAVKTERKLSGENMQKPPLKSECSSFSTYKKEVQREKMNVLHRNFPGTSASNFDNAGSSDIPRENLVSAGSGVEETSTSLESQCSRDEDLPGLEVPGRNSHKVHTQSKEGSRNVSERDKVMNKSEVPCGSEAGSQRKASTFSESQNDADTTAVLYKRENSDSRDVSDLQPVIDDLDEEICRYGSDHDIDMESSDDELEAPEFLVDLENAWRRPVPGTPPPRLYESPVHSGSPLPMGSVAVPSRVPNSKFSLDYLLAEETDKTDDQVELEEIHARLERDVRMGGFVKDTLEKESPEVQGELLPEQQAQIQQLEVLESVLRPSHPGEKLFSGERYQHLFTSALSPQECGFTPGTSYIDKHLATLQPANYNDLFTSHLLMECLQAVSDPSAVLRWIFLYMSTERSSLAVNGCFDVLEEYYYCQKHFKEDKPSWAPTVGDVLSAICNFGCDPNALLPSPFLTAPIKSSMLPQQQNVQAAGNNGPGLQVENLRLMLVTLTYALQNRSRYKAEDLTHLLIILCCTALDEHLCSELLTLEFQCCIGAIVENFKDSDWESQASVLCRTLALLTDHHHNMVYLCSLLPLVPRGTFLQCRVSYLCLRRLFGMEVSNVDLDSVKLKCLHKFPPLMRELVDSNMYKVSSCLNLLDKCIGCGTVKLSEKDDLYSLTEYIKKMAGEIRENVRMLDKSRLKDLMVRLTSKWTMLMISCGSSQKTLFAYAKANPQKIKIETVQASQSDADSEQSDQSETEMEYSEIQDN